MEHFLILLISYILLSSPVTGGDQKWETLYKWGDSFSGYVWKGSGRKENLPTYKGDVKNGVPNGLGIIIYPYGDEYLGEWDDGKKHGEGTETFSGGEFFVGKWFENIGYNGTYSNNTSNTVSNIENGKLK